MDIVEDDVRNRFIFTPIIVCFCLLIVLSFINSSPSVIIKLLKLYKKIIDLPSDVENDLPFSSKYIID